MSEVGSRPTVESVAERLSAGQSVIVHGSRRSGKSYLAEQVSRLVPGSRVLAASSLLVSERWQAEEHSPADQEIAAVLAGQGGFSTWVVDDAHVLVAHCSGESLGRLAEAVKRKQLTVLWVRNRFVHEETGWFAERESDLRALGPTLELHPYAGEDARRVAGTFLQRFVPHLFEECVSWLVAWSGGAPGWMFQLAPRLPLPPGPADPSDAFELDSLPREFASLAETLTRSFDLKDRLTRQVLERAVTGGIPSPAILDDRYSETVGFLQAAGVLETTAAAGQVALLGRLWRKVARRLVGPPARPATPEKFDGMALTLEQLADQAKVAPGLRAELGCGEAAGALAVALLPALSGDPLSISAERVLGTILGRVGVRKLLRAGGVEVPAGEALPGLTRRVLELVQAGAP